MLLIMMDYELRPKPTDSHSGNVYVGDLPLDSPTEYVCEEALRKEIVNIFVSH